VSSSYLNGVQNDVKVSYS